jgi:hypothetical protein
MEIKCLINKFVYSFFLLTMAWLAQADTEVDHLFMLQAQLGESRGVCFDIPGYRATIDLNIPINAHTCKPNPDAREDMIFRLDYPSVGNIYNTEYEECLDTVESVDRGSVYMRTCTDSATQKFDRAANGELKPMGSDLCLAVSPSPWHPAVLAGVVPEPGVTFTAKAMSLAPCDDVADELKSWAFQIHTL